MGKGINWKLVGIGVFTFASFCSVYQSEMERQNLPEPRYTQAPRPPARPPVRKATAIAVKPKPNRVKTPAKPAATITPEVWAPLPDSPPPPPQPADESQLRPAVTGERTKVVTEAKFTFAWIDEATGTEFYRAIDNDREHLSKMLLEGRVVPLDKGTSIVILDRGFASTTVRVDSGPYDGKTFIMANEFLGKVAK